MQPSRGIDQGVNALRSLTIRTQISRHTCKRERNWHWHNIITETKTFDTKKTNKGRGHRDTQTERFCTHSVIFYLLFFFSPEQDHMRKLSSSAQSARHHLLPPTNGVLASSSLCTMRRSMSFNGHAWISSLRYGFPCGPQLGSFAHQYCPIDPNERHIQQPPAIGAIGNSQSETHHTVASTSDSAEASHTSAAVSDPSEKATIYLGDMSSYPELRDFSYNRSPCRSAPKRRTDSGALTLDSKAAKLLMERRHDAAEALHLKKKQATSMKEGIAEDTALNSNINSNVNMMGASEQRALAHTLTFDLLRQIREMYREEMLQKIGKDEKNNNKSSKEESSAEVVTPVVAYKREVTLDDILLDDAAIYTRAIVYVSGGSRLARDWLAGLASVCSSHPSIVAVAMHHQGTHEDLEDFARYCEIVGYCDDSTLTLRNDSRLLEPMKRSTTTSSSRIKDTTGSRVISSDTSSVVVDLAAPISPPRQADIIKRCLIYDSMTALHFMEFNADLLDMSRIRAAATYLGLSAEFVDQLRELVLAEHSLISEKHATIDAPAAMSEGRLGMYSRQS